MRFERHLLAAAFVPLVALGICLAGCGGGSSGGGESGVGGTFRVIVVDAFPNGPLMPAAPQPATENQYIAIEFSKGVDPATLFDASTVNGVSSALRLINHFYVGSFTPQNPPTQLSPQSSSRLQGFLMWNGQTNFNRTTGTFGSANQLLPITATEAGISTANYTASTNLVYFVADRDRNPGTRDSFLPSALNSSGLQASQLQVEATTSLRSQSKQEPLAARSGASFNVGTADYIFPRVDNVTPADNGIDVDVNGDIKIRFIEPIEASTVILAPPNWRALQPPPPQNLLVEALVVGPTGPTPVQLLGTVTPTTGSTDEITFTPQVTMPGNTLIRVTITDGAGNYIDLSNNELAFSSLVQGNYSFTTGAGPKLANNPVAPMVVHFLTGNSEISAVEAVDNDGTTNEDFLVPIDSNGATKFSIPGNLLDIQFGGFIAVYFRIPGSGNNFIGNSPQQNQYLAQGIANGNPPRPVQFPLPPLNEYRVPGTQPDNRLCKDPRVGPPVQPIGNFLFVSNEDKNVVHVINSNTYQIYKDIQAPDPRGLAVDPLLNFLFVSNFGGSSVSVFDITADPNDNLPRGLLVRTIPTGNGPDSLCANPNGEDLFVVNRQDNSVSVIQMNEMSAPDPVRVTVTGNIGPVCVDCCATGRIPPLPPQFPNLPPYAYFANLGADNIAVFESGPQQVNGYGRDNIIQVVTGFDTPTAVNSDERSGATAASHDPIPKSSSLTGCWVACSGDNTAKYLRATRFRFFNIPNPPPAFIGVDYEISTVVKTGDNPRDVVLHDPYATCNSNNNKHVPDIVGAGLSTDPQRMYVANGDGSISVIDLATGTEVLRLANAGARKMAAYYTN